MIQSHITLHDVTAGDGRILAHGILGVRCLRCAVHHVKHPLRTRKGGKDGGHLL